jgi:hypothetical protein
MLTLALIPIGREKFDTIPFARRLINLPPTDVRRESNLHVAIAKSEKYFYPLRRHNWNLNDSLSDIVRRMTFPRILFEYFVAFTGGKHLTGKPFIITSSILVAFTVQINVKLMSGINNFFIVIKRSNMADSI